MTQNPDTRLPKTPRIRVYTALLTQNGTTAPTAVVLQNTLDMTVTWTRNSEGNYSGTFSEQVDPDTLHTSINGTYYDINYGLKYYDQVTVLLATANGVTAQDNCLLNTPVDIKIYDI